MSHEAPLSALLEVLARSQRELESLEAERARSKSVREQARSLISGAGCGHAVADVPAEIDCAPPENPATS